MSDAPWADAVTDRRMTPNRMEEECLPLLERLLAEREAATDKRARKALSSRIKSVRIMIKWARTRAGYVAPSDR